LRDRAKPDTPAHPVELAPHTAAKCQHPTIIKWTINIAYEFSIVILDCKSSDSEQRKFFVSPPLHHSTCCACSVCSLESPGNLRHSNILLYLQRIALSCVFRLYQTLRLASICPVFLRSFGKSRISRRLFQLVIHLLFPSVCETTIVTPLTLQRVHYHPLEKRQYRNPARVKSFHPCYFDCFQFCAIAFNKSTEPSDALCGSTYSIKRRHFLEKLQVPQSCQTR
jgi:hypothetical protein